jgi:hypothetical protein
MTSGISQAVLGYEQVGGEASRVKSRWVVERETWRPRLKRWDVRYCQVRPALGLGWYKNVRYASKFSEDQARAVAAGQLRLARAVPLIVAIGR